MKCSSIATIRSFSLMAFGSVRLRARELDHLGPLLGFLDDELAEVGRRAWKDCAQLGETRFHLAIGKAGIDFLVERANDLRGRVRRRANAKKCARLEARQKITHGRKVR